jgi:hypothetical protein
MPRIEDPGAPASAPDAEAEPPRAQHRVVARIGRVLRWMRRNAYLTLIVGAVMVLTRAIDFEAPDQVRVGKTDVAKIVGDAPAQEFSHELSNPQSVQVRATLRLYSDNELVVSSPDPGMDEQGRMLSQPVVTTILGMNATIEQTMRLEEGDLEIDLTMNSTPRLEQTKKKGNTPPPIVLESEIVVKSRRTLWWTSRPVRRVHLDSRAFLTRVEDSGHRVVFTVDDHLFSLDLDLHRAFGPMPDSTLASSD